MTEQRLLAAPLMAIVLILSGCTAFGSADSTRSDGEIPCTESTVDQLICDDLQESYGSGGADPACDLPSGEGVFTPAFAEIASKRTARCDVPEEAQLIESLRVRGGTIDGFGALGEPGTADYDLVYLARGNCGGEPTYWPESGGWTQYKLTSPYLTSERFTLQEVVDLVCS